MRFVCVAAGDVEMKQVNEADAANGDNHNTVVELDGEKKRLR
jgi:hypothetical protein